MVPFCSASSFEFVNIFFLVERKRQKAFNISFQFLSFREEEESERLMTSFNPPLSLSPFSSNVCGTFQLHFQSSEIMKNSFICIEIEVGGKKKEEEVAFAANSEVWEFKQTIRSSERRRHWISFLLSCSKTCNTHTQTHSLSLSATHSFSYTHTYTLSLSLSHSLILLQTHILSFSYKHTHTHTHTWAFNLKAPFYF